MHYETSSNHFQLCKHCTSIVFATSHYAKSHISVQKFNLEKTLLLRNVTFYFKTSHFKSSIRIFDAKCVQSTETAEQPNQSRNQRNSSKLKYVVGYIQNCNFGEVPQFPYWINRGTLKLYCQWGCFLARFVKYGLFHFIN